HRLAMSQWLRKEAFSEGALTHTEALDYLKRNPLRSRFENGWVLPTFEGVPLGWLKQIGNRSNNYYPQKWRIRIDLAPEKFWSLR
ncbi:MAG: rRNA cytosine-C5-methyltransferase, partial [Bacteroidota bacterium]